MSRVAVRNQPAGLLATVAGLLLLAAPAAAAAASVSRIWGKNGEAWDFNRLPDFSFAGYKFGTEPVPDPPVTRFVLKFRKPGMSDSQMLLAAVDWANRQPLTNGHIVLSVPTGTYTLTDRLVITRSRVVLRGAGSDKTVLYIPKSLTDRYGPNRKDRHGAYVNADAFVIIKGNKNAVGPQLATITKFAAKGSYWVEVDSPQALKVGEYFDTWWTDINGAFNNHMFDNKWVAPNGYKGSTQVKFTSKILAIQGNRVKLERRLPYNIQKGMNVVKFHARPDTVMESGVEGITFSFKWEYYAGHHLERGWNAVQLMNVRDVWVRDIQTVNADNSVLIHGASSSTVAGVRITVTKSRANNFPNPYKERANTDGHWGVEFAHSFDLMIREVNVDTIVPILHSVGTANNGKWSVIMNCRMRDGNLDLHRGLSGPTLYTQIDVGIGSHALSSGGPVRSGPNALAGTTFWNIKSKVPVLPNDSDGKPGACSYGPVINLVNINIVRSEVRNLCPTWLYERSVSNPANLYEAQYALRMKQAAAAMAA